jgi:hypothetical protein
MSFRTPKYRLHKGSGQALVQIDGERTYLGKYDTEESKEEYRRLVAEFLASSPAPKKADGSNTPARLPQITINDLILTYWQFAQSHYLKDGKPTETLAGIRAALRPLRAYFGQRLRSEKAQGHSPAADRGRTVLRSGQQTGRADQEAVQVGRG